MRGARKKVHSCPASMDVSYRGQVLALSGEEGLVSFFFDNVRHQAIFLRDDVVWKAFSPEEELAPLSEILSKGMAVRVCQVMHAVAPTVRRGFCLQASIELCPILSQARITNLYGPGNTGYLRYEGNPFLFRIDEVFFDKRPAKFTDFPQPLLTIGQTVKITFTQHIRPAPHINSNGEPMAFISMAIKSSTIGLPVTFCCLDHKCVILSPGPSIFSQTRFKQQPSVSQTSLKTIAHDSATLNVSSSLESLLSTMSPSEYSSSPEHRATASRDSQKASKKCSQPSTTTLKSVSKTAKTGETMEEFCNLQLSSLDRSAVPAKLASPVALMCPGCQCCSGARQPAGGTDSASWPVISLAQDKPTVYRSRKFLTRRPFARRVGNVAQKPDCESRKSQDNAEDINSVHQNAASSSMNVVPASMNAAPMRNQGDTAGSKEKWSDMMEKEMAQNSEQVFVSPPSPETYPLEASDNKVFVARALLHLSFESKTGTILSVGRNVGEINKVKLLHEETLTVAGFYLKYLSIDGRRLHYAEFELVHWCLRPNMEVRVKSLTEVKPRASTSVRFFADVDITSQQLNAMGYLPGTASITKEINYAQAVIGDNSSPPDMLRERPPLVGQSKVNVTNSQCASSAPPKVLSKGPPQADQSKIKEKDNQCASSAPPKVLTKGPPQPDQSKIKEKDNQCASSAPPKVLTKGPLQVDQSKIKDNQCASSAPPKVLSKGPLQADQSKIKEKDNQCASSAPPKVLSKGPLQADQSKIKEKDNQCASSAPPKVLSKGPLQADQSKIKEKDSQCASSAPPKVLSKGPQQADQSKVKEKDNQCASSAPPKVLSKGPLQADQSKVKEKDNQCASSAPPKVLTKGPLQADQSKIKEKDNQCASSAPPKVLSKGLPQVDQSKIKEKDNQCASSAPPKVLSKGLPQADQSKIKEKDNQCASSAPPKVLSKGPPQADQSKIKDNQCASSAPPKVLSKGPLQADQSKIKEKDNQCASSAPPKVLSKGLPQADQSKIKEKDNQCASSAPPKVLSKGPLQADQSKIKEKDNQCASSVSQSRMPEERILPAAKSKVGEEDSEVKVNAASLVKDKDLEIVISKEKEVPVLNGQEFDGIVESLNASRHSGVACFGKDGLKASFVVKSMNNGRQVVPKTHFKNFMKLRMPVKLEIVRCAPLPRDVYQYEATARVALVNKKEESEEDAKFDDVEYVGTVTQLHNDLESRPPKYVDVIVNMKIVHVSVSQKDIFIDGRRMKAFLLPAGFCYIGMPVNVSKMRRSAKKVSGRVTFTLAELNSFRLSQPEACATDVNDTEEVPCDGKVVDHEEKSNEEQENQSSDATNCSVTIPSKSNNKKSGVNCEENCLNDAKEVNTEDRNIEETVSSFGESEKSVAKVPATTYTGVILDVHELNENQVLPKLVLAMIDDREEHVSIKTCDVKIDGVKLVGSDVKFHFRVGTRVLVSRVRCYGNSIFQASVLLTNLDFRLLTFLRDLSVSQQNKMLAWAYSDSNRDKVLEYEDHSKMSIKLRELQDRAAGAKTLSAGAEDEDDDVDEVNEFLRSNDVMGLVDRVEQGNYRSSSVRFSVHSKDVSAAFLNAKVTISGRKPTRRELLYGDFIKVGMTMKIVSVCELNMAGFKYLASVDLSQQTVLEFDSGSTGDGEEKVCSDNGKEKRSDVTEDSALPTSETDSLEMAQRDTESNRNASDEKSQELEESPKKETKARKRKRAKKMAEKKLETNKLISEAVSKKPAPKLSFTPLSLLSPTAIYSSEWMKPIKTGVAREVKLDAVVGRQVEYNSYIYTVHFQEKGVKETAIFFKYRVRINGRVLPRNVSEDYELACGVQVTITSLAPYTGGCDRFKHFATVDLKIRDKNAGQDPKTAKKKASKVDENGEPLKKAAKEANEKRVELEDSKVEKANSQFDTFKAKYQVNAAELKEKLQNETSSKKIPFVCDQPSDGDFSYTNEVPASSNNDYFKMGINSVVRGEPIRLEARLVGTYVREREAVTKLDARTSVNEDHFKLVHGDEACIVYDDGGSDDDVVAFSLAQKGGDFVKAKVTVQAIMDGLKLKRMQGKNNGIDVAKQKKKQNSKNDVERKDMKRCDKDVVVANESTKETVAVRTANLDTRLTVYGKAGANGFVSYDDFLLPGNLSRVQHIANDYRTGLNYVVFKDAVPKTKDISPTASLTQDYSSVLVDGVWLEVDERISRVDDTILVNGREENKDSVADIFFKPIAIDGKTPSADVDQKVSDSSFENAANLEVADQVSDTKTEEISADSRRYVATLLKSAYETILANLERDPDVTAVNPCVLDQTAAAKCQSVPKFRASTNSIEATKNVTGGNFSEIMDSNLQVAAYVITAVLSRLPGFVTAELNRAIDADQLNRILTANAPVAAFIIRNITNLVFNALAEEMLQADGEIAGASVVEHIINESARMFAFVITKFAGKEFPVNGERVVEIADGDGDIIADIQNVDERIDDKQMTDKQIIDDKIIDSKIIDKKIIDDKIIESKIIDKQIIDKQIIDKQIIDKKIIDNKIIDKKIIDNKIIDKQIIDKQIIDKQIIDKKIIDNKIIDSKIIGNKIIDDKIIESKIIDSKIIDSKIIDSKIIDKKIIDDKIIESKIIDKQIIDKQIIDKQIIDKKIIDNKIIDKKIIDNKIIDKQIIDKQIIDKQIIDKKIIDNKIIDSKIIGNKIIDDKIIDSKIIGKQIIDKQIIDKQIIDNKIIDSKIIDKQIIGNKIIDDKIVDDKIVDDKIIDDKIIDNQAVDNQTVDDVNDTPVVDDSDHADDDLVVDVELSTDDVNDSPVVDDLVVDVKLSTDDVNDSPVVDDLVVDVELSTDDVNDSPVIDDLVVDVELSTDDFNDTPVVDDLVVDVELSTHDVNDSPVVDDLVDVELSTDVNDSPVVDDLVVDVELSTDVNDSPVVDDLVVDVELSTDDVNDSPVVDDLVVDVELSTDVNDSPVVDNLVVDVELSTDDVNDSPVVDDLVDVELSTDDVNDSPVVDDLVVDVELFTDDVNDSPVVDDLVVDVELSTDDVNDSPVIDDLVFDVELSTDDVNDTPVVDDLVVDVELSTDDVNDSPVIDDLVVDVELSTDDVNDTPVVDDLVVDVELSTDDVNDSPVIDDLVHADDVLVVDVELPTDDVSKNKSVQDCAVTPVALVDSMMAEAYTAAEVASLVKRMKELEAALAFYQSQERTGHNSASNLSGSGQRL